MKKTDETGSLSEEQKAIYDWLSNVRFKRKLFGGLDEADVWKKIEKLNSLYEKALLADRVRRNEEAAND